MLNKIASRDNLLTMGQGIGHNFVRGYVLFGFLAISKSPASITIAR